MDQQPSLDVSQQQYSFKTPVALLNAPKRKLLIEQALRRLKIKNNKYLEAFQTNHTWKKIEQSYAILNIPTNFQKIVRLSLCEVQEKQQTLFNPFQKIPIMLCYNKIGDQDKFNRLITYNLILLHDSKAKRNINWNNINHVIKSNIRALHISEICKKNDLKCFEKELSERVTNRQRFKGVQYNFTQLYNEAIQDFSPINQTVFDSEF